MITISGHRLIDGVVNYLIDKMVKAVYISAADIHARPFTHGFQAVDAAPPDFELLVKRFSETASIPRFKGEWEKRLDRYDKGLTIIRADQCPYTVKNVGEISETAEKEFGIKADIVDLKSYRDAQNSPCAFGIFCIICFPIFWAVLCSFKTHEEMFSVPLKILPSALTIEHYQKLWIFKRLP